ncbi:MAG: hypothetical protein IH859_06425, partial [Chloroflexi bacterium]|nr:hypothetical protein [Chloroflexota bacterium]
MENRIDLGTILGLRLRAHTSAVYGSLLLWATLSAVGLAFLQLSVWSAIIASLVATLLHWDYELWHQLGHAWAA